MKIILSSIPLLLLPSLCLAIQEDPRKAPHADPWGIVIFLGMLAVAVGWLVWRMRRASRKDREQAK
jgi:hypothetical protein